MTEDDVRSLFEKHEELHFEDLDNKFYDFEQIVNPPTKREDLCAMLKLEQLVQSDQNILTGAGHDEIWFSVSFDDLAAVNVTEEDVIYLIRCGVRTTEYDCLGMFV
jgi:hypothetical protein